MIEALEDSCSSEISVFITAHATESLVVLLLNKIQHQKSFLVIFFTTYRFISFYDKYLMVNIFLRKKMTSISANDIASFRFPQKIFLSRKLCFALSKMNTCYGKNEHPAD